MGPNYEGNEYKIVIDSYNTWIFWLSWNLKKNHKFRNPHPSYIIKFSQKWKKMKNKENWGKGEYGENGENGKNGEIEENRGIKETEN